MECLEAVELGEAVDTHVLDELSSPVTILPLGDNKQFVCKTHFKDNDEPNPHAFLPNGKHACEKCIQDDTVKYRLKAHQYCQALRRNLSAHEFGKIVAFILERYPRDSVIDACLYFELVACSKYCGYQDVEGLIYRILESDDVGVLINYDGRRLF
jgi:hypothetical protein